MNVVDLFAGAGGLSNGLEMVGFNILLEVDKEAPAMETFKLNHDDSEIFCGDIQKLSEEELVKLTRDQDVHLVCGGPPCQGFSTSGKET